MAIQNKIVKRLERWAAKRHKRGVTEEEKLLREAPGYLREKEYELCGFYMLQPMWMHTADAIGQLIKGKHEPAFAQLAHAVELALIQLRLEEDVKIVGYRLHGFVGTCALMMALGQWNLSRLWIEQLDLRLAKEVGQTSMGEGAYPWEGAICALQRIAEGADPAPFGCHHAFGIYSQVFAHWHDEKKLASILPRCCDYHLAQYTTSGEKRVDSMGVDQWSLGWPLELLAIWQARHRLGLSMPVFSHELVKDNPLYFRYPTELPPVKEDDPVLAMFRKARITSSALRNQAATMQLGALPIPAPKRSVPLAQFRKWLLEGTDDSLQEAVTTDFSFSLGHRETSTALLDQVQAYLGYDDKFELRFRFERPTKGVLRMSFDGRQVEENVGRVSNPYGKVMAAVDKAVQPAFVVKGFAFTRNTDTHFYCILPTDWFESFSRSHPGTARHCFADCDEMVCPFREKPKPRK